MNLFSFLKRWLGVMIIPVIIAIIAILILNVRSGSQYSSVVKLQFATPQASDISVNDRYRFSNLSDEILITRNNFREILLDSSIFNETAEQLDLDESYDLEVSFVTDSDFINVSVSAVESKTAALAANTHVNNAIKAFGELRALPARALQDSLEVQLSEVETQLETAQQALLDFQTNNSIFNIAEQISLEERLITDLKLEQNLALISGENLGVLDRSIAQRESELFRLLALRPIYDDLERTTSQLSNKLDSLRNSLNETDIVADTLMVSNYINVVKDAEPALSSSSPYLRLLPLAAVGGLGLGVLLAFLLDTLFVKDAGKSSKAKKRSNRKRNVSAKFS